MQVFTIFTSLDSVNEEKLTILKCMLDGICSLYPENLSYHEFKFTSKSLLTSALHRIGIDENEFLDGIYIFVANGRKLSRIGSVDEFKVWVQLYFQNDCNWPNGRARVELGSECIRIFVAGDRSQVGKSSICVGLLASLLEMGYNASEIAYIKPATQCEKPQLVGKFCKVKGIHCVGIGPIVYFAGFTRAYLKGDTPTAEDLLDEVARVCDDLAKNRRVLIVDGVGYPAVGSICNLSNAHVAKAAKAPVLLVGRSGVGDAIDSYNLNASYFEQLEVPVLGAIFNKLALDGYYSIKNCSQSVNMYFRQQKPHQMPYGFLPLFTILQTGTEDKLDGLTSSEEDFLLQLTRAFLGQVNLTRLCIHALSYRVWQSSMKIRSRPDVQERPAKRLKTRDEIQRNAVPQAV